MKNYFTIEELSKSETAELYNIDNTPSDEIIANMSELIIFLNKIREAWGSAILVTSGYRCEELNKKVGGSDTSVHKIGFAADIVPQNGEIKKFINFVIEYVKNNNLHWDQIIDERSGNVRWLHIGLYNNHMQQRMQIKELLS